MPMENGLPLLEPPPNPPQFPQTNINVTPQGMVITVILAPGIALSTNLNAEMMDNVLKLWRQVRVNEQDIIRTIEAVRQSKIN